MVYISYTLFKRKKKTYYVYKIYKKIFASSSIDWHMSVLDDNIGHIKSTLNKIVSI